MCLQSHLFSFSAKAPPAKRARQDWDENGILHVISDLGTTVKPRARVAHARISRVTRKLPRQTNRRLGKTTGRKANQFSARNVTCMIWHLFYVTITSWYLSLWNCTWSKLFQKHAIDECRQGEIRPFDGRRNALWRAYESARACSCSSIWTAMGWRWKG